MSSVTPNPNERIKQILENFAIRYNRELDYPNSEAYQSATAQILELIAEVIPEKRNVAEYHRKDVEPYNQAIDEMRARVGIE